MEGYSIGELAASVGVATSAVRFYERSGLLKADYRSESNYRYYSTAALERLRFIRSAQAVGLSLDDIKELLRLTDSNDRCGEVQSLLNQRIADVRTRMRDLRRVERTLTKALRTCCQSNDAGLCEAIGKLQR